MKRIFVTLSRILGNGNNTPHRHVSGPWEMVVPTWTGTEFKAPANVKQYGMAATFSRYLKEGHIILVNEVGGWNFLHPTDIILSMDTNRNAPKQPTQSEMVGIYVKNLVRSTAALA